MHVQYKQFLLFLPLFFKIKTFLVTLEFELLLMSTEAVIDQPIVKQPWGCLVSMNPKYPSLELYDDEVFCGRKNPDMKSFKVESDKRSYK